MDLKRLREETRPEHEATEALMPLTGPDLTLNLYTGVLATLLGLMESWEGWAAGAAPARLRPLLAARRRSHLIRDDLRFLGAPVIAAPRSRVEWTEVVFARDGEARQAETRPTLARQGERAEVQAQSDASFLGAFYVFEGSTLGGRFLARHVDSVLHLAPGRGSSYFQGHGEATGTLWRETTAQVAAIPEGDTAFVVDAARRTFVAFGAVLRLCLPSEVLQG